MKQLSADAFYTEAFTAFQQYGLDNPWFAWYQSGSVFDLSAPVTYIFAAFAAYEKVCQNEMKLLILGDTKLRTDYDLVMSFGLSSARGVQEQECRDFIAALMNERKEHPRMEPVVPAPAWKPDAKVAKVVPVEGAGAVLSTRKWSPMLNDSFIMAGAHRECEFFLALSGEDTAIFDNLAMPVSGAQEMWRQYFLKNPGTLWASDTNGGTGNPRVLLRELIGLKTFGYEPRFDKRQLGFKITNKKASDGATLSTYLVTLTNLGFHKSDKKKLVESVATFLFDDARALDEKA